MTTQTWLGRRARPLVLVAVGGFIGAVLRHALAVGLPASFPVGTLAANVFGAYLLGVLLYGVWLADLFDRQTRLVLGTGFCSSLTTYSTFAVETSQLAPDLAAANVGLNYALGFAAVVLGRATARWLW